MLGSTAQVGVMAAVLWVALDGDPALVALEQLVIVPGIEGRRGKQKVSEATNWTPAQQDRISMEK